MSLSIWLRGRQAYRHARGNRYAGILERHAVRVGDIQRLCLLRSSRSPGPRFQSALRKAPDSACELAAFGGQVSHGDVSPAREVVARCKRWRGRRGFDWPLIMAGEHDCFATFFIVRFSKSTSSTSPPSPGAAFRRTPVVVPSKVQLRTTRLRSPPRVWPPTLMPWPCSAMMFSTSAFRRRVHRSARHNPV